MKVPIVRLEMAVEGYAEYLREPLSSAGKAAEWIGRSIIRHYNREHIIVVGCDASGRAIYIDEIGRGSANYCPGTVPEIFKAAIMSNATQIFIFHSHPGGDPAPSRVDREFTERVRRAGGILDIGLTDHIIIGRDGTYYSFMEDSKTGGSHDISGNSI